MPDKLLGNQSMPYALKFVKVVRLRSLLPLRQLQNGGEGRGEVALIETSVVASPHRALAATSKSCVMPSIPTGLRPPARGCPVLGTTLGTPSPQRPQPQRGCAPDSSRRTSFRIVIGCGSLVIGVSLNIGVWILKFPFTPQKVPPAPALARSGHPESSPPNPAGPAPPASGKNSETSSSHTRDS